MKVLWTYGTRLSVSLLIVYLVNYYRTISNLLFWIMVIIGYSLRYGKRLTVRYEQEDTGKRDQHAVKLQDMVKAEWLNEVTSEDMEKVEWLNEVIQQAWPSLSQYLKKLLIETNSSICFTKIDFGVKPIKVVGVKTHKGNEKGQILLYVDISYEADVEINAQVYFCKAGVKGIQLCGVIGVILGPLIDDAPVVGAVTIFFIKRPKLIITWTGLTEWLNIGFKMLDTMALNKIESFLVWPNHHTIPQVADLLCSPQTKRVALSSRSDVWLPSLFPRDFTSLKLQICVCIGLWSIIIRAPPSG